jgi:phage repressor protein C with HTH and peptisase S24 domain
MVGTRAPLASEAVRLHLISTNPGFCRPVNPQAHPPSPGWHAPIKGPALGARLAAQMGYKSYPGNKVLTPGPGEPMLTHAQLWTALDRLAARAGLSASGLAKAAGLDPTSFNKSKRITPEGRERWPSTESVAKALAATQTSLDTFVLLIGESGHVMAQALPLIGYSATGNPAESSAAFDDAGIPVGKSWAEITFPDIDDENTYGIEVSGNSLEPTYRDGTLLIVSPNASIHRGDRVVVKTKDGKVTVSELKRRTSKLIELRSLDAAATERTVSLRDVLWLQRIVWASQ